MNNQRREQVLKAFTLTHRQELAALARGRDVAVTAGAGSGKTSTLVARYASLLADGVDLRRVIAITFSDKAAREMRSRTRKTLGELVSVSQSEERVFWLELNARMDSARISTIHSLCAEILRAHPVEAVVDPKFEVVDESLTVALRAQVIKDTLAGMVGMPEFEPLFGIMSTGEVSTLLTNLIKKRLEAVEALESEFSMPQLICRELRSLMEMPALADPVAELRGMRGPGMFSDAGATLAGQVEELLDLWAAAQDLLASGDYVGSARALYSARREKMSLRAGNRGSETKEILRQLQTAYDVLLDPVCGGKSAKIEPLSREGEEQFLQAFRLLKPAFDLLMAAYREGLDQLGGLDFDDLESGAVHLLQNPAIRELWQSQIDAVLVDEFQDTNQRQRDIVEALAGSSGWLFVVGDAKQSIYRFRRADVTVFRDIRRSIAAKGGLPVDLDQTFRTHAPLLAGMNELLCGVMGDQEDPTQPYYEPFSPLVATRESPREGVKSPFLEVILGSGESADDARPLAARALADRLLELKAEGQIKNWDDVTLLFRASTTFPHYENAFEDANIPFVTVAGRGFYDRAEIRDLLNLLRALADPGDDLAMAGLLRSPAFGLTDAALYQLRWKDGVTCHYWAALNDELADLSDADRQRALRVVRILDELLPLVDRIPVAELLKKLVDATDYRSILAIEDTSGGGGRLWRNLDKLIEDAQASGKVNVRDFLEYLSLINDAGAREGEAPAEALGAVRLMTIHKSKGLQYPVVVLADAARSPRAIPDPVLLLPGLGLSFKLDPEPMLYRLAKLLDQRQGRAEEHRVLYVALTRAQEKLIISGHVTGDEDKGWTTRGWLEELCGAAGLDFNAIIDRAGTAYVTKTPEGHDVRCWAIPANGLAGKAEKGEDKELLPEPDILPLYAPVSVRTLPAEEDTPAPRTWRVTGGLAEVPANVVGNMVHKAIELWLFPGDARLQSLLETTALNEGLADERQREAAVAEAVELLGRLQAHPMRAEIEAAEQVYHELPYSRLVGDHAEMGYIDLLYRDAAGWQIVDFKTDVIYTEEHREELVAQYARQMRRYAGAVEQMLRQQVRVRLCFLDDRGRVGVVESNWLFEQE